MQIPLKLKPGQVWMGDKDFPYQHSYKGEFGYILLSKEPNEECWKVAQWQEWEFGAQIVEFNEEEIRLMKYVGTILQLRNSMDAGIMFSHM